MADWLEEARARKDELTPDAGYALVGLDDFDYESPLFLIDNFETYEEADAARRERWHVSPDLVMYIYSRQQMPQAEYDGTAGRPPGSPETSGSCAIEDCASGNARSDG